MTTIPIGRTARGKILRIVRGGLTRPGRTSTRSPASWSSGTPQQPAPAVRGTDPRRGRRLLEAYRTPPV